ncbi:MAG: S1 RNA-binding domain-containing protein [Synergistaceae bacterium]|nr:S1 RNA-binding domain-containing protein [Synergistaceae bacterium]
MGEAKTTDLTAQNNEVHEGEITECIVEQIMPYGAFVKITKNGRKGMIHISELSYSFVKNISDVLKINEVIDAKIIRIDERGRIDLSLKQTHEPPQQQSRPARISSSSSSCSSSTPRNESIRPQRFSRPQKEFKETHDYHEIRESMNIPPSGSDDSFEQKMSAFLKTSEAKITDLNTRNSARSNARSSSRSKSRGGKRNNSY